MTQLAVQAAMCQDLALRARIAVLLEKVAIDVLAEAPLPEDAEVPARLEYERRHAYAGQVLGDPGPDGRPAEQAQWAAACWSGSSLVGTYATDGANGPTDADLEWTLLQVWNALTRAS